jgi:hypothetical protein
VRVQGSRVPPPVTVDRILEAIHELPPFFDRSATTT